MLEPAIPPAADAGKALVAEDSEGDGVEDDGPVLVEDAPASPSEAPATSTDAPAADKLSSPDMAPRSLSEPKACEASIQEALDAFVKGMREALPPRTLEYAGGYSSHSTYTKNIAELTLPHPLCVLW